MTDTRTQAHTAGKIRAWRQDICCAEKDIDGDDLVIGCVGRSDGSRSHEYTTLSLAENKANLKRLVDCWNALEGLNPDAIADVVAALRDIASSRTAMDGGSIMECRAKAIKALARLEAQS